MRQLAVRRQSSRTEHCGLFYKRRSSQERAITWNGAHACAQHFGCGVKQQYSCAPITCGLFKYGARFCVRGGTTAQRYDDSVPLGSLRSFGQQLLECRALCVTESGFSRNAEGLGNARGIQGGSHSVVKIHKRAPQTHRQQAAKR